jgi:ketosteroid isomerase-like protein
MIRATGSTTVSTTGDQVRAIFSGLEIGHADSYFRHVAEDVDWTIQGTHPLAGRYRSKAEFRAHTFARLGNPFPQGLPLRVTGVLVSGD